MFWKKDICVVSTCKELSKKTKRWWMNSVKMWRLRFRKFSHKGLYSLLSPTLKSKSFTLFTTARRIGSSRCSTKRTRILSRRKKSLRSSPTFLLMSVKSATLKTLKRLWLRITHRKTLQKCHGNRYSEFTASLRKKTKGKNSATMTLSSWSCFKSTLMTW